MTTLECIDLDDLTLFRFHGPLDSEGLDEIEATFESAVGQPGLRAVVDLSQVNVITTPAISMFISAATRLRKSGGRLVLAEVSPLVRNVIQCLRLGDLLSIQPDVDARCVVGSC